MKMKSALEAFSLTMAAGLLDATSAEKAITEHHANFSAFLVGEYDMEPPSDRTLSLTRNPKLLDKLGNDSINGDKEKFMRDGKIFWNCRRFFCTTQGYFGLGPQSLMEGDLCCVLFGAKVPFDLREVDGGSFWLANFTFKASCTAKLSRYGRKGTQR